MFTVGLALSSQSPLPPIQSPGEICSAGTKRTTLQGRQREGPRGGHQVGRKGGTRLPGSPHIPQAVGSVCSFNSGGVCDCCEVLCLLSSCTVKAAGPILTVQTPHCWVDPSHGQNTEGHWAELALLSSSTNLAKVSAFTHCPHHTVTLDPSRVSTLSHLPTSFMLYEIFVFKTRF